MGVVVPAGAFLPSHTRLPADRRRDCSLVGGSRVGITPLGLGDFRRGGQLRLQHGDTVRRLGQGRAGREQGLGAIADQLVLPGQLHFLGADILLYPVAVSLADGESLPASA